MKPQRPHSALRLVGDDVAAPQRLLPRGNVVRQHPVRSGLHAAGSAAPSLAQHREVEEATRAASMSALDPRWALAVRANSMLQGGRAAILTPECRRLLVRLGQDINLRPFDANLIIAIVQDAARCGQDPLGVQARNRLAMITQPKTTPDRPVVRWMVGALGLGGLLAWFLVRSFGG